MDLEHVADLMQHALDRRYDGPIPDWELLDIQSDGRKEHLSFYRARALEAARQCRKQLQASLVAAGPVRVLYWLKASASLQRYVESRSGHSHVCPVRGEV